MKSKNAKIIGGIVSLVLSVGSLVFAVASLVSGLPKEGALKGSIRGFKPLYTNQGLFILIAFAVGALLFLGGIYVLILGMREEGFRNEGVRS